MAGGDLLVGEFYQEGWDNEKLGITERQQLPKASDEEEMGGDTVLRRFNNDSGVTCTAWPGAGGGREESELGLVSDDQDARMLL